MLEIPGSKRAASLTLTSDEPATSPTSPKSPTSPRIRASASSHTLSMLADFGRNVRDSLLTSSPDRKKPPSIFYTAFIERAIDPVTQSIANEPRGYIAKDPTFLRKLETMLSDPESSRKSIIPVPKKYTSGLVESLINKLQSIKLLFLF
jgi:hypothetical protein